MVQAETPYADPAYFIWLAPTPGYPETEALEELLQQIQSQTKTPRFSPHVTLYKAIPTQVAQTALIDALTSALTLWRSMSIPQPLCLPFTETAATSKYFQSLFALVQKNNEPLRSLWQAVDGTLSGYFSDKASWPAFMPHLSLMYGTEDEVPPSTKADVILQLEKSGVIVKTESGLMLNGVKELPAKALDVVLVRSEGPVESWQTVHRTPLLP